MNRKVISYGTQDSAIPFSPGIKVGETIYCSGQVGINPQTGELAGPGIKEQTEQVLENLKEILELAGSSLEKVDKSIVFLTEREDYSGMNEVYRKYFSKDPPARSTVVVSALVRPEFKVEIECIAHL